MFNLLFAGLVIYFVFELAVGVCVGVCVLLPKTTRALIRILLGVFIAIVLACIFSAAKDKISHGTPAPDESVLEHIRADECKRFPDAQGMREYCK